MVFVSQYLSGRARRCSMTVLCRWLEEEIGSSELARRIRNGKESGTNFQNLVISVVGAVDLFTNQELAELGSS